LSDYVTGTTTKDVGRPTELTPAEEDILAERCMLTGTWGFPMTTRDLCHLVRDYLNAAGKTTRYR